MEDCDRDQELMCLNSATEQGSQTAQDIHRRTLLTADLY